MLTFFKHFLNSRIWHGLFSTHNINLVDDCYTHYHLIKSLAMSLASGRLYFSIQKHILSIEPHRVFGKLRTCHHCCFCTKLDMIQSHLDTKACILWLHNCVHNTISKNWLLQFLNHECVCTWSWCKVTLSESFVGKMSSSFLLPPIRRTIENHASHR